MGALGGGEEAAVGLVGWSGDVEMLVAMAMVLGKLETGC